MSITAEEIKALFEARRRERGAWLTRAEQVRDQYNADIAVPLPEMSRYEMPAVANLLQRGLDGTAQRIASTTANLYVPPVKDGDTASMRRAAQRRRAYLGWWHRSAYPEVLGQRARHLIGYASSPVCLSPDFDQGIPAFEAWDPLGTYPAKCARRQDITPTDCIRAFTQPWSYIKAKYAHADAALMGLSRGRTPKPDDLFQLLTYVDAEEYVTIVIGKPRDPNSGGYGPTSFGLTDNDLPGTYGTAMVGEIDRYPNRAGVCPVVIPSRTSLDRPLGQFDGMLGMFMNRAQLTALELIAVRQGVFPEQWFVKDQAGGRIVTPADPVVGTIGEVFGGKLETVTLNPGYRTDSAIDRIERAERIDTATPAEFGGESPTNVRTDRRGLSVLGSTIDFGIAENQRLLARSAEVELSIGVAISKGYFRSRQVSMAIGDKGAKGRVAYVPEKIFETDEVFCRYALPGTDQASLVVSIGQRVGIGEMSVQTSRELDPLIDDPELEGQRVLVESLEKAQLAGLQQAASSGTLPPADLARIEELVVAGSPLRQAVLTAQSEAQARQATSGEPGTPAGPVDPNSPAAQPGLAQAGQGAESGTPEIGPQGPSLQNLSGLLGSLRTGGRAMASAARGQ